MAGPKMNADWLLMEECKIGWVKDKSGWRLWMGLVRYGLQMKLVGWICVRKDSWGFKNQGNIQKTVPGTNGGSLRIRLANPYQRILYFSLKTMFCILKLHGVLLKQPPFVPGGLLKKSGFPMTAQKSVEAVCVIEPFRAFWTVTYLHWRQRSQFFNSPPGTFNSP